MTNIPALADRGFIMRISNPASKLMLVDFGRCRNSLLKQYTMDLLKEASKNINLYEIKSYVRKAQNGMFKGVWT